MDLTRSVLARPGAPVMRQWPPANRATSSCSMTSFCPTMTLASSDWIWVRLEMICSTICFSVVCDSVVVSIAGLVSHRVKDDVDSQGISFLFGEFLEVVMIFSFAFPAVAVVGVVTDHDHHPALIVKNGFEVDIPSVAVVAAFPGDAAVVLAHLAILVIRHLHFVF